MKRIAIITGIMVLVFSTTLNAQRGQGRMMANNDSPRYDRECRIPDITDEQQQKIDDLRTAHFKAMKNYRADLDIARAELHKLMAADKADKGAIDKKIDEMGTLKTTMQKERTHHHLDVRNLLTDDQKVWFDQHNMHRKGGKGRGYRGHHNGMGHGMGQGCRGQRGHGGDCPWR